MISAFFETGKAIRQKPASQQVVVKEEDLQPCGVLGLGFKQVNKFLLKLGLGFWWCGTEIVLTVTTTRGPSK